MGTVAVTPDREIELRLTSKPGSSDLTVATALFGKTKTYKSSFPHRAEGWLQSRQFSSIRSDETDGMGLTIGDALFPSGLRDMILSELSRAQFAPLRIRLTCVRRTAAVPWELARLWPEESGEWGTSFVGEIPNVSIVRDLIVAAPSVRRTYVERHLASEVIPERPEAVIIDAFEKDPSQAIGIRKVFADSGVKCQIIKGTIASVKDYLAERNEPVRIAVFVGHADSTRLHLNDAADAGLLVTLLAQRGVRLLVLNSCGAGAFATDTNLPVELQPLGIPAIIAWPMQISAEWAQQFTITFFKWFLAGRSFDASLAGARAQRSSSHWPLFATAYLFGIEPPYIEALAPSSSVQAGPATAKRPAARRKPAPRRPADFTPPSRERYCNCGDWATLTSRDSAFFVAAAADALVLQAFDGGGSVQYDLGGKITDLCVTPDGSALAAMVDNEIVVAEITRNRGIRKWDVTFAPPTADSSLMAAGRRGPTLDLLLHGPSSNFTVRVDRSGRSQAFPFVAAVPKAAAAVGSDFVVVTPDGRTVGMPAVAAVGPFRESGWRDVDIATAVDAASDRSQVLIVAIRDENSRSRIQACRLNLDGSVTTRTIIAARTVDSIRVGRTYNPADVPSTIWARTGDRIALWEWDDLPDQQPENGLGGSGSH